MLQYKNNLMEVGLDEAGRGPLIGRVYAGAVIWKENVSFDLIMDSKKLTPAKRKKALEWIKLNITYWGVGYADEKEIDSINILNATKLAMTRAIDDLKQRNPIEIKELIIDGTGWEKSFMSLRYLGTKNLKEIPRADSNLPSSSMKDLKDSSLITALAHNYKVESVIKGDNLYYSIAAASIIAKEYHDAHIKELINIDPILDIRYNLSSNMGYPTKKHRDGIKQYGISIYHRKSFNGC